jgi:predicted flavoprotein YhiN
MVVDPMIRSLSMARSRAHAWFVAVGIGVVLVGGGCGRIGYDLAAEHGKQISEATPTGHPFQSVTAFCNPVLTAP